MSSIKKEICLTVSETSMSGQVSLPYGRKVQQSGGSRKEEARVPVAWEVCLVTSFPSTGLCLLRCPQLPVTALLRPSLQHMGLWRTFWIQTRAGMAAPLFFLLRPRGDLSAHTSKVDSSTSEAIATSMRAHQSLVHICHLTRSALV